MNGKQYRNIIDWTVKHDDSVKTGDSLDIARAIFKNMGVALPQGDLKRVAETLKTDDYMGWKACSVREAQEAADNGIAAIGVAEDQVVVLSANVEDEPIANMASVMTLSESTSAYAVSNMQFYSYAYGTTTQHSSVLTKPTEYKNHRVGVFETPENSNAKKDFENSNAVYNTIPWNFVYETYYTGAMLTAQGGDMLMLPDAANLLRHFLKNLGSTQTIDFERMNLENSEANAHMVNDINTAISAAEYFMEYYNNSVSFTTINEITGYNTSYDSSLGNLTNNWYQAIGGYRTWYSCLVSKNGNAYTMTLEYNMRDFYDWNPEKTNAAPLVSQEQMYLLHCAGMAKHFKVKGQMKMLVTWSKGQTIGNGATYQII